MSGQLISDLLAGHFTWVFAAVFVLSALMRLVAAVFRYRGRRSWVGRSANWSSSQSWWADPAPGMLSDAGASMTPDSRCDGGGAMSGGDCSPGFLGGDGGGLGGGSS